MAFGKPQYAGNKTFTKYVSLQEDKPIVGRIIPPINSLAADGIWAVYHSMHWGYRVPLTGGEPGKTKFALFACVEEYDFKNKIIKVECPECAKIRQVEEEIKELEVLYKGKGKSEADIKELLAPKKGYLKQHNRDGKQYINFELETGEIVVLTISNKTYKEKLKPLLKKLEEKYGWDEGGAILNGVVFKFSCTGKGATGANAKVDEVEYVTIMEEIEHKGKVVKTETVKCVEWTEAAEANAEAKGIDLRNPDRFIRISSDQIRMMVSSSGDPDEIADILKLGERAPRERSPKSEPKPIVNKPAEKPAPKSEPVEEDEEAALERQLAEARAKKAAAKAQAEKPAPKSAQVPAKDVPADLANGGEGISDEDFMKSIGGMEP